MTSDPISDFLDRPLRDFIDNVASKESVPSAGPVIAALGALSAGLTAKVAHRSSAQLTDAEHIATRADVLRSKCEPIITTDALGYAAALSKRGDERVSALESLSRELVLLTETAAEIAELATVLVNDGNQNLRFDADAAVRIAVTVAEIGAELVRANVGDSDLSKRARYAASQARAAGTLPSQTFGSIE